jgi:micrococcal nuclease
MRKWFFSLFIGLFILSGCSATPTPTNNQSLNQNRNSQQTSTQSGSNNVSKYPTFPATIVSVTDGDTFKIKFNNKVETVRLLLCDTPETVSPRVGVEPYGPEASKFTKSMLPPGKQVIVEKDVSDRDKYGRLLAYVYVDGKMINELLIEKGLARVAYVYVPNTRYVDEFRKIQEVAKQKKLGIWSIENYASKTGFNTSFAKPKTNSSSYGSSGSSSYPSANHQGSSENNTSMNSKCVGKIKGNANSHIYHIPSDPNYKKTTANVVWFCTTSEAKKAGYRAPR